MNPWSLFSLALLAVIYGVSYMLASLTGDTGDDLRLTRFGDTLPLSLYAGVWLVVGVACFVGLFSRRGFKVSYAALTSLMLVWSAVNLGVYVFGGFAVVGSIVSAAVWGSLAICTHTLSITEQTALKVHDRGVEQATEAVDQLVIDLREDDDERRGV